MDRREKKSFSLISRIGSFKHAFRGVYVFVKNTHNAWVEIFFGIASVFFGFWFSISEYEWLSLLIVIFMLLMAEAFNTAMEVHMDLTSPNEHPFAKDTKDIAAGAVFIAVLLALIVFGIIFIPKIIGTIKVWQYLA